MANVLIESQTMTDIANAIREKSGTVEKMKPAEMPQAVRNIKSDDIKLFNYYIGIHGFNFSDLEVEHLIIELPNYLGGVTLIEPGNINSLTKEITLKLSNKIDSMNRLVYGATYNRSVKILNLDFNTSNVTSFHQSINCLIYCETINGVFDFSNAKSVQYIFNKMNSLVYVRFAKETLKLSISILSAYLSDESIQSIIDGLADLTGQTAQTITFHTTVKNKLTEEQIASATSKNWNIA